MRAPLTRDRAEEVVSLYGQSRDVLRALVSVAGWYRLPDAPDGDRRYAPTPDSEGLSLDAMVAAVVAESRALLARDEGGQGHEQAGEQRGSVHAPTVALVAGAEQLLRRLA